MKILKDEAMLQNEQDYVLYFTAEWCGDCRFIEPKMPEIEAHFPEFQFIKVDRDEWIDLAVDLNVMGIPSFIAYRSGKEVDRFVGRQRKTQEEIEQFLRNALAKEEK